MFFFNDTATTEIYTLSLRDALPICTIERRAYRDDATPDIPLRLRYAPPGSRPRVGRRVRRPLQLPWRGLRSEEHTSELQSRQYLVCRLLLEKKVGKLVRQVYCILIS